MRPTERSDRLIGEAKRVDQTFVDLAALVSHPVFVARQKKGHCLATGQLCKLHSLRVDDAERFVERRRRNKGKLGSLRQVQNAKGWSAV